MVIEKYARSLLDRDTQIIQNGCRRTRLKWFFPWFSPFFSFEIIICMFTPKTIIHPRLRAVRGLGKISWNSWTDTIPSYSSTLWIKTWICDNTLYFIVSHIKVPPPPPARPTLYPSPCTIKQKSLIKVRIPKPWTPASFEPGFWLFSIYS